MLTETSFGKHMLTGLFSKDSHWIFFFFFSIQPPPPLVKVIEDLPKSKPTSGDLKMKVTSRRVQRPAKSRENQTQTRIVKQDLTGKSENKEVRTCYN